jgi:hypothetical protein
MHESPRSDKVPAEGKSRRPGRRRVLGGRGGPFRRCGHRGRPLVGVGLSGTHVPGRVQQFRFLGLYDLLRPRD